MSGDIERGAALCHAATTATDASKPSAFNGGIEDSLVMACAGRAKAD